MGVYGAELPEGAILDEGKQTYGSELPEGAIIDEQPQETAEPESFDGTNFTDSQREAADELVRRGELQMIGGPETPGTMPGTDPAFGSIEEAAKAGVKTGIHYMRPTIEGVSAATAGTAATLAAIPATGPFAPAVGVTAAAGAYTAAKGGLDMLETWAKLPPEIQKKPSVMKWKQNVTQWQRAADDFKTGLTFEVGGANVGKVLSLLGEGGVTVYKKVKDVIRKNTPALSEEQVSKRAAEIIQEHRGNLKQYDDNLAESIKVGDEIPGFKSTVGQKTGDPGLIKLQRGLETKPGVASELDTMQQAENVEAIEGFLKGKFEGVQTIDDVLTDLTKQKTALRAGTETAERTAKATEEAIPTETPQVTGKKITETIEEAKEPVKKLEKEYWGKVPNYEMSPTSTEEAFKEISTKPSTARKKAREFYNDFIERKGGTTSQTIKLEELRDTEREINAILFDINADANLKRVLGKVKTAINDDFKALGEAAEQGDFATIKGKVVHPKQMEKKLAETESKLIKEGAETAASKPDIKAIQNRIQDENIPGMMQQVQEPVEQWEKRMVKSYKTNFGDPPMLQAKEKSVVTRLKGTKATLEKQLSEAEPAENAAVAYANAKAFSKSQVHDRFRTGVIDELEMSGKFEGGKKLPAEARPRKLMDVESADKFINAVGGERAGNIMLRHYADDMSKKVKVGKDGRFESPSLTRWVKKNQDVLNRYGIKGQFNTTDKAHKAMQSARVAEDDFSKSIAAKMLNSDPQNAVSQAFSGGEGISSKNTGAIMRNLMKRVAENKDATKGLENGFKDFMYEQAKTTAQTLKGKDKLSKATLDKSLRKYAPAMAVLYKGQPDKIKALQTVRKALLIMNRTAKGVGGGPDTAEKMSVISSVIGAVAKIPGISYTAKLGKLGLGKLKNLNEQETSDFVARLLYDPDLAKIINRAASKKPPVKKIQTALANYMERALIQSGRTAATEKEKE